MDWLSPLDASFLHLEDDGVSHMHIGSTTIFEGPVPSKDEFDGFVAGKLPLVPGTARRSGSYRPISVGRHGWTTPISTSAITCATRRWRSRAARPSCALWWGGSCRSGSTGASRCGRCGRSRAWRTELGAGVQGPSLHGRWRLGHRSARRAARRRHRHRPSRSPTRGDRRRSRARRNWARQRRRRLVTNPYQRFEAFREFGWHAPGHAGRCRRVRQGDWPAWPAWFARCRRPR